MKNTTPAKLRRPPRPPQQPATKSKVNQCQILATGLMWRRFFESFYDAAISVHDELGSFMLSCGYTLFIIMDSSDDGDDVEWMQIPGPSDQELFDSDDDDNLVAAFEPHLPAS